MSGLFFFSFSTIIFKEFLTSLGYPVESMEDIKILKLYEASKEFYQFEMFKMGYIQIFED